MHMPPQPIRLIAIDLDGTLLTPEKQITSRTRLAIQAAQDAGIMVTLATARRYGNSRIFADALGLRIPIITCDGALIVQHPDGSIIHTHRLPATLAHEVVNIMVKHRIQPVVHHINGNAEETWTGLHEFDNGELTTYFSTFPDLLRMAHAKLCYGQPDPLRVVAFASEEAINKVLPEITALSCSWDTLKRGSYGCAEISIMHPDCSKATGVTALAQRLGIPLAQVMAIGDNTNDRAMLQAVGWGVAMGQAEESIKALAQAVTTSNTDDGVARAIETYALGSDTNVDSNSLSRTICL